MDESTKLARPECKIDLTGRSEELFDFNESFLSQIWANLFPSQFTDLKVHITFDTINAHKNYVLCPLLLKNGNSFEYEIDTETLSKEK